MIDYATWAANIKGVGGVPTAWPFDGASQGMPAALFTSSLYADLFNTGILGAEQTAQATRDNSHVYVLYTNVSGAPHTLTASEKLKNAVYIAGDRAADALGLPSLSSLETATKLLLATVIIAALAFGYSLYRKGKR